MLAATMAEGDAADPYVEDSAIVVDAIANEGDTVDVTVPVNNTGDLTNATVNVTVGSELIYSQKISIPTTGTNVSAQWDSTDESSGNYAVKVEISDPESDANLTNNSAQTSFYLNARPVVDSPKVNLTELLRNETIMVNVTGEDLEDDVLQVEVRYKYIFGNWRNDSISNFYWDKESKNGSAIIRITTDSDLGLYSVSARLRDSNNATSNWSTVKRVFEVKNNQPQIVDGNIADPAATADEDTTLSINLTTFASDVEDGNANLRWYVEHYDDKFIKTYTGDNSTDRSMNFTLFADYYGETDVDLVVYDTDGDVASVTVTLRWNSVNDVPVIDNVSLEASDIYRGETLGFFLNASEVWGEDDEDDMNVTVGYYLNETVNGILGWMSYDAGGGYFTLTADNWTKPDMLPLGSYSFNFTLNDTNVPSGQAFRNLTNVLTVKNSPIRFVDDTGFNSTEMFRGESITVYVNATDYETEEWALIFQFQVRHVALGTWNDTFLNASGYDNDTMSWVFGFSPEGNATLGNYSIRVRLTDGDGNTTGWVRNDTTILVKNNPPQMDATIDLSVTEMNLAETVTLGFNGSDMENDVENLSFTLEYNDSSGWDTSHFSDLGYNRTAFEWEANFTPPLAAEIGLYSFRIKVTDRDGGVSAWLYKNDSLTVKNNVPTVVNASFPENSIYRTDHIFVYANGSGDRGTGLEESYLNVTFNVRRADDSWYNFTDEDAEVGYSAVYNCWVFNFSTETNYALGNYSFRVRMKLNDSSWSDWFDLGKNLSVMNNEIAFGSLGFEDAENDTVYRDNRFYVVVNGSDVEDGNKDFITSLEYSSPSIGWTALALTFNATTETWNASLDIPTTAVLEKYSFRTRVNDTNGSSTGWRYFNDSVEVINNPPTIGNIPSPAGSADEDETIQVDLTAYESDVEDSDSADLTWTVVSYGTDAIEKYTRRVDYDRFIFTPRANFSGDSWAVVRLTDSDGGLDEENITLRWNEVNDKPFIYSAYLASTTGLRDEVIPVFINGSDAETDKEDVGVSGEYRIIGSWKSSNFTSSHYDPDIDRFVLNFTPNNYTSLGDYEFRVKLTDGKDVDSDVFYLTTKLTLRNRPSVSDLSTVTEVAYEGDMIHFTFNSTDREEDEEKDLDNITLEFRLDDLQWNASNFSGLYFDDGVWHVNFTVPFLNATAYDTSFRVSVTDSDDVTSYHRLLGWTISLRKKPASIPDYHIENRYITVNDQRSETVHINDGESVLLNTTLQNRGKNESADVNFTVIYEKGTASEESFFLGTKSLVIEWWDTSTVSYLWDNTSEFSSGNYSIYIEVFCKGEDYTDDNNASSLFVIEINLRPLVNSTVLNLTEIYRTESLMVNITGEDLEDKDLAVEVLYRPEGGNWTDWGVSNYYWNKGTGKNGSVIITISADNDTGYYNLSVRIRDPDGGRSEYFNESRAFRVLNNLPSIDSPIIVEQEGNEDTVISVDLSSVASDTESDDDELLWYVKDTKWFVYFDSTGNSSVITDIAGENDTGQELSFTPEKDFYGAVELTLVVEDTDGGTTEMNITLNWTGVNDKPMITDIAFGSSELIRGNPVSIYVTVSDIWGEDADTDLTVTAYEYNDTTDWQSWDVTARFDPKQDRFETSFTPDASAPLGSYSFNFTVEDTDSATNHSVAEDALKVLNAPPRLNRVYYSENEIYRTFTLTIYLNLTDYEDESEDLTPTIQYRRSGTSEWETTFLSDLTSDTPLGNGIWRVNFTLPKDAEPGEYEFRVKVEDTDDGSSGWNNLRDSGSLVDVWEESSWLAVKLGDISAGIHSVHRIADMDGDDYSDIVTANTDGEIFIWKNSRNPFEYWESYQIGDSDGTSIWGLAVADLDNDSDMDIITGDQGTDGTIYVWENDGTPYDGDWEENEVASLSGQKVTALEAGDLDDDGFIDIVTANDASELDLWQNNGSPFDDGWSGKYLGPSSGKINCMELVDLDNDDDPDVATGDTSNRIYIWQNPYNDSSNDPFSDDWWNDTIGAGGADVMDIAAADIDDDNDMDLITGNRHEDKVYVWMNPYDDGDNVPFGIGWSHIEVGESEDVVIPVAAGDLDSDDDMDIISGDHTDRITLWENDGSSFSSLSWSRDTTHDALLSVISADGEYLAAGTDWGVYFFDTDSSSPEWSYNAGDVRSVDISADGEYIVVGSASNDVYLFDKDSSLPIWNDVTGDNVPAVAISADGEYLVAGSLDGYVYYYDKDSSTPLWEYDTGDRVRSVAISEEGDYIAVGNGNGADEGDVLFFDKDFTDSTYLWKYDTAGDVWTIDISSDGEYIVAGNGASDDKLFLLDKDFTGNSPLWSYSAGDTVRPTISYDGEYILAGDSDGEVYLFDRESSTPLWTYTTGDAVRSVSLSEDGSHGAVASLDDNVYFFERKSSAPLWNHTAGDGVYGVSVSADGDLVTAASYDDKIYLFERGRRRTMLGKMDDHSFRLQVRDMNRDGNPDIVSANSGFGSMYIWFSAGGGNITVLNTLPSLVNMSSPNIVNLNATHTIFFNLSDVEDPQASLGVTVEYSKNGTDDWKDGYFSNKYHDSVRDSWRIDFSAPLELDVRGYYDLRFDITDNDGGNNVLYRYNAIFVRHNAPVVDNISASSDTVYRNATITIYANGTGDFSDSESYFNASFQYYHEDDWRDFVNSPFFGNETSYNMSEGFWQLDATPSINFPMDETSVRVRFKLNSSAWSDWLALAENFTVLNNIPTLVDFDLSNTSIYRAMNTTELYINGTDVEDAEEDLTLTVQYKAPSGGWTSVGAVQYDNGFEYFMASFQPKKSSPIGSYSFRVRLRDTNNTNSGWYYFNNTLTVLNNPPTIKGTIPSPAASSNEDSELYIRLSSYEDDIENGKDGGNASLRWSVVAYDDDEIDSYTRRVDYDQFTFTPVLNFDGDATVWFRLSDADGGSIDTNITLRWNPVNDPPEVEDASLGGTTDVLREEAFYLYINATDVEDEEKDLTTIVRYQHEDEASWWSEGVGSQRYVGPSWLKAGHYDTDDEAWDAEVVGDYAYVADWFGGLIIIDISDKTHPQKVGDYDTDGYAIDVAVAGNYAYVADYDDGLIIVDITNKTNPQKVGGYDTDGNARGVAVVGDYAYVVDDGNGLVIVDISNKTDPQKTGHYDTSGTAVDVVIAGDYAYVADGNDGLVIVDITDKIDPQKVGDYGTASSIRGIAVMGDYLYAADGTDGLVVIDITDTTDPQKVGDYDTAGFARRVAVAGDYAYVADAGSLVIIDITDKTDPQEVDDYDTTGSARGVAVAGDYIYVADHDNGLVIVENRHGYLRVQFTMPDYRPLGNYSFRVQVKDTDTQDQGTSAWFYIPGTLRVWNNPPGMDDLTFGSSYVYRGSDLYIYLNASDIEDDEDLLAFSLQYNTTSNGTWREANIADDGYDDVAGAYVFKYTPELAAVLENLSFRAWVTDVDGNLSMVIYENDSVEIWNNPPEILDLDTLDVTAVEDNELSINLTAYESDLETTAGDNLTWFVHDWDHAEIVNITGMNSTADDNITFTPAANFTGDSEIVLALKDADGGVSYQRWNLSWSSVNDAPVVKNITLEENPIFIGGYINMTVEVEDDDDDASDLHPALKAFIKHESEGEEGWTAIPDADKEFRNGHTHFDMLTDLDYPNGFYDIRINVTDSESNESSKVFAKAVRLVGQAVVENFTSAQDHAYRNMALSFYINGTDLEDDECLLTPHMELYVAGEWNTTINTVDVFSAPVYVQTGAVLNETNDYWVINFTAPTNATLGNHNFRVRFNDTFTWPTYSTWKEIAGTIEIRNNNPEIQGIPAVFNGFEDHRLLVNLTNYEWDMEDDDANLTWSVESYDVLYLDSIVRYDANNSFMFEPDPDVNNGTDITLRVTDKDGGYDEVVVQLFFKPIGDNPRITDLEIVSNWTDADYIYNQYTTISANVTGSDPEGTRVMFQYLWYYNDTPDSYLDNATILDAAGDPITTPSLDLGASYYINRTGTVEAFQFTRNMSVLLKVTPYTTEAPVFGNASRAGTRNSTYIIIENTPPKVTSLELEWRWQGLPQADANITSTLSRINPLDPIDPDGDDIDETELTWYHAEKELAFTKTGDHIMNEAQDVAVDGDYAFVADGGDGLAVIDISDETNPQEVGRYNTGGTALGVAVFGDYVYVADDSNGLLIIDITDKADPQEVGDYDPFFSNAKDVTVSGDYAYVAYGSRGLYVIDITDKTDPQRVGRYNTDGDALGVAVSGNYAYVADDDNGLVIVDITDETDPQEVGHYDTSGSAEDVAVMDDHAYLVDSSDGLLIIDITDETDPQEVGSYDSFFGGPWGIAVAGEHAYVAVDGAGLSIMDISDTTDPKIIRDYRTPNNILNVAVVDNLIYAADWDGGLVIIEKGFTLDWTAIAGEDTPDLELYSYAKSNPDATESLLEKGMYVTLGARARDDFYLEFGNETLAEPVLIVNSLPVMRGGVAISSSFIDDQIAYTNSTLTAIELDYHDIDDDARDHYNYSWAIQRGGVGGFVSLGEFDRTLSSVFFNKTDVVRVTLKAFDGTEYSVDVTADMTISNAPPSLASVQIKNQTYPIANLSNTLDARVFGFADIDGDAPGPFVYTWYRNGGVVAGETGSSLYLEAFIEGGVFNEGDAIHVVVTPVDEAGLGGIAVTSAPVIIQNTLPVINDINFIIEDDDFGDGIPRITSRIIAEVTAYDVDNDTLHYTYVWHAAVGGSIYDEAVFADSPNATNLFPSGNLSSYFKNAEISLTVRVSDNRTGPYYYFVSDDSWNFSVNKNLTIANTPPQVKRFTLTNRTVEGDMVTGILNENGKLVVEIDHRATDVTDPDSGDDFTAYCQWYIDGAPYPAGESVDLVRDGDISSAVLSPAAFSKGQDIYVELWADDGDTDGISKALKSYVITVQNTPPELKVDDITRIITEPLGDIQEISAVLEEGDYEDLDGDELDDYYYKWYNGINVVYEGWGDGFERIDNTIRVNNQPLFEKGDTIRVGILPNDGEDNGTELVSDPVYITNQQPVVVGTPELVAFSKLDDQPLGEGKRVDQNSYLMVVGDITDPDDLEEDLFFVVRWLKNGEHLDLGTDLSAEDRDSNYLSNTHFTKGDVVSAEYWASDGSNKSAIKESVQNTITIDNTLPVAGIVSPVDGGIYRLEQPIEFNASTSSDLDKADKDRLEYRWTVDGVEISTEETFMHAFSAKGTMTVVLEVTDGDGEKRDKTITIKVKSPELSVKAEDIIVTGVQEPGEEILVLVTVENAGDFTATMAGVTMKVNGQPYNKTKRVNISVGTNEDVRFFWTPKTKGTYTITVVVNEDQRFAELDDTDNTASIPLSIQKEEDEEEDQGFFAMLEVYHYVLIGVLFLLATMMYAFVSRYRAFKKLIPEEEEEPESLEDKEKESEDEEKEDEDEEKEEEAGKEEKDSKATSETRVPEKKKGESPDSKADKTDAFLATLFADEKPKETKAGDAAPEETKGKMTKEEKKRAKEEEKLRKQEEKEAKKRAKEEDKQRKKEEKKKGKTGQEANSQDEEGSGDDKETE